MNCLNVFLLFICKIRCGLICRFALEKFRQFLNWKKSFFFLKCKNKEQSVSTWNGSFPQLSSHVATWNQFHQHFTRIFFVQKFCGKHFVLFLAQGNWRKCADKMLVKLTTAIHFIQHFGEGNQIYLWGYRAARDPYPFRP
jgi:hypothetical protein